MRNDWIVTDRRRAYGSRGARSSARLRRWVFTVCVALAALQPLSVYADARTQARRIHDRIAGVPPSAAVLDDMASDVGAGRSVDAAYTAMANRSFYDVTLKNFAMPWTNRDQTVFAPLNDYVATVIGMVRDDVAFNTLLSDDILYTGRTTRAAMDALFRHGRPKQVQLCVLIDRGHRELPIEAGFVGRKVQTTQQERIELLLREVDDSEKVLLVEK